MADRRRNLFILLIVAGLLIASLVVIAAKPTRQGLDLKGGVSLVYEAKPTRFSEVTSDAIQRSIDIMRSRVDQLGVSEPEIQQSGSNQIDVSLPSVSNADQAQQQVGTTAQLYFYDWEAKVVGKDGKPHPSDAAVTGGGAAGTPGAGTLSYYDAVTTASRFKATNEADDTTNGLFYGVDTAARKVICGPQETEQALLDVCRNDRKTPSKVVSVPRGYVIIQAEGADSGDPKAKAIAQDAYYVLKDDPALRGTDIKNPEQQYDNGPGGTGQPNVTFEFTGSGASKWQTVTRRIAQRGQEQFLPGASPQDAFQHFAIVLDNALISAPYIDFQRNPDGIDGRSGSEISGGFTIKSAQNLSNLLKTGALPIKLDLISQSTVSATLGKQALHQGLIAGIAGFAVVALFLVAFYRVLGLIAVGALLIYAIYFFALIKLIPITLTLPGIAGLILTIGVAADANIVIFERVKEEIRAGRSVAAGIAQGYKKGLSAIVDANVVTFMVAFILFILATAGVKGFAFTLGIGTLTSLFTAVLATQAVLGTMGRSRYIHSPAMLGAGETNRRWTFDFMGASRWFFSFSGVILLACALALGAKGLNFGIDFESGTRVKTAFTQPANESQIRSALEGAGYKAPEIQRVANDKELGGEGFQISLNETGAKVAGVENVLNKRFGQPRAYQSTSIGPTFGATVAKSAIIAIIASLLVISVYIALRFEWRYAVPVLIALVHDLLITSGVYALTGREVSTSTVAALLTILGFSLYDTIIVFDRIRENAPRMPRAAYSQIVNRSMSEVLTRSLATSFCTLLPVLALLLFGGATLKDFAFALLVGIASGTYSSVFIGAPVLVHWKERDAVYRRRRAQIAQANGGVVPAYATADHGITVEPRSERRAARRVTAPDDPERGVSKSEFDAMVRDIQHETAPTGTPARRGRRPDPEPEPEPAAEAEPERESPPGREQDPTADAQPEDLVLKDTTRRDKNKRSRTRRHGRPR
jgi:SecD/SecF fusion protein